MDGFSILDIVVSAVTVCALVLLSQRLRRPKRLPPGPRRLPIVGNILDLPPPDKKAWLHWEKHKEKYGPISSVSVMGKTIIIINDFSVSLDLLDRRSAILSDRPVFPFAGDMVGYSNAFAFSQYDERHKRHRRIFHKYFATNRAQQQFMDVKYIEVRRLLALILQDPVSLVEHLRKMAGAVVLLITHGYNVGPGGRDHLVDLAYQITHEFSHCIIPGHWAVDIIPALKYLPDWFPGTSFKRIAKRYKRNLAELCERPLAYVRSQLDSGRARPSFVSTMLPEAKTAEDRADIKWCAAAAYGAGVDTTAAALYTFFLAMTLYPEVQRRAQKELDKFVGDKRFPNLEDRSTLPYINAVMKESLRWQLVAPLAIPHCSSENVEYNGYFIPKGSMLLANCWAIAHDPNLYKDPMEFRPERFLNVDGHEPELDPYKFVFGYGRRLCPGKEFADTLLWLTIAMSLSVFDIRKVRDEAGNEIIPEIKYSNDLVTCAINFPCLITARSERAALAINSVEVEHPYEPSDAEEFFSIPWSPPA